LGRRSSKEVRLNGLSQRSRQRIELNKQRSDRRYDSQDWTNRVLEKINEIKRERRVLKIKTVEVELTVLLFRNSNDGVAGAIFKDENGETFKVASLFSDNQPSIYEYLPNVIDQIINELTEETETLVISSCSPQFTNGDRFLESIGDKRIQVIPVYKEELFSKSSEAYILAMDASKRHKSVVSEV
jgi:hypothetical protein